MGDFEDILSELRAGDIDGEDAAERLEKFSGSSLRKRAEGKEAAEARLAELEAENRRLKTEPKVVEALKKAGVDFEGLRPAEVQAIKSLEFEGEAPAEDWVAKVVSDYGFPMSGGVQGEPPGNEPAAAAVARAAQGAPAGGGTASGVVTPDDFGGWPLEKRLRFIEKYPEAEESLGKGIPMTGVAFS